MSQDKTTKPAWNPNKPACPIGEECDDTMTVGRRASDVETMLIVDGRCSFDGLGDDKDETEDAICDLLADIFHLCDKRGVDVHEIIDRAQTHWEAER